MSIPVLLLVAGLSAWVAAWAALRLDAALARRREQQRFARGRELEAEAARVLSRKGFSVADRRVRRTTWVEVDGERHEYAVEADYLVHDLEDRLHVAEVKSGEVAPDPLYVPTRRQLLEYRLAFPEAEGLLLVDMERETVVEVAFPEGEMGCATASVRCAPALAGTLQAWRARLGALLA